MKKSFFPVILAAMVLLSTSCIKNVESDGVKAVRTGQAALLTAQATAATTIATSQAALNAANAALLTAQAGVQTAQAATENAKAALQVIANAAATEKNRHDAAVYALDEAVKAATTATDKAKAVNALAEENARSANELVTLAQDKADLETALAKSKIQSESDLADAQLLLDQAKLDNIVTLATAKQANIELLAALKATGLGILAADYQAAYATYLATQVDINLANVALINLKASLATATTDIADSTTVKNQRAAVATSVVALASANDAVVTATTDNNAALAIIESAKAAKAGTALGVILTANQAKLDAEKIVYANLYASELVKQAEIFDADAVSARAAANAAETAALTAKNTAGLDTVTKKNAVTLAAAAVTAAKADTATEYTAYKVTLSHEHLNAGASFAPPRFVTVFNAPAAELEEAVGGVWNSLADRTEETNAINAAAARKTTYDAAKAALVTAQTALATANTAFTASKTAYATKATAYDVAKAAAKVLNDANQVLVDAYNVIVAKTAASDARINNLDAFILLLNGWIDEDPQTTSMDQAIADAELAQDNIDPLAPGTKQLLAAAEDDVVTATADLEAAKTELTAVIASYKMDLPLDQNGVVYLTTQIADKTAEIANLTSILAQQKAVVDMWLAKITAALTAI